jgi:hypothetical protein
MGERFRLRADFDISGFSPANQVILTALKRYGMIVADNGSNWFLSGAPDPRWNDDDIDRLKHVLGNAFEAVDLTPAFQTLDVSSGPTAGGTTVVISGYNFSGGAGLAQVYFGGTPAASFQILSDTQILATSPAHGAGVVDVTVSSGYGTSPVVGPDQFAFIDPSPPSARGGNRGVLLPDLAAVCHTEAHGTRAPAVVPPLAARTADGAAALAAQTLAMSVPNALAGEESWTTSRPSHDSTVLASPLDVTHEETDILHDPRIAEKVEVVDLA